MKEEIVLSCAVIQWKNPLSRMLWYNFEKQNVILFEEICLFQ